ncbi:MAG: glutamine amidotransferase [Clostridiales bacterium]|nr:glutamine amidotransferase [Clostridiales bacterium]
MTELTIGHFYPDLLNLYGDRGNVLALYRRAVLRGIRTEVRSISVGDELKGDEIDIAFLGGGQDSEQNIMNSDLRNVKGKTITGMIESGVVFLCICGGYQMLGRYYKEIDGSTLECLGYLDLYTEGRPERFINDTVYELTLDDGSKATIVGFENHSGRTYFGDGSDGRKVVKPFMKVITGHGNNGEDGYEGAVYKNTFCTYSHGSLLPKNPEITDMLLLRALKRKYGEDYILPPLDSSVELRAKEQALDYIKNGKEQMI